MNPLATLGLSSPGRGAPPVVLRRAALTDVPAIPGRLLGYGSLAAWSGGGRRLWPRVRHLPYPEQLYLEISGLRYPRAPVGLARSLWLAVLLLAVAGAADLVSVVYRQTILQTYAPDEMRGRMQGVFTVVVSGGPRLGDLRAGTMAAAVGLSIAWSGSAAVCFAVVVIAGLSVRSFWRYEPVQASGPDATETGGRGESAEDAGENGPQAEDSRRAS